MKQGKMHVLVVGIVCAMFFTGSQAHPKVVKGAKKGQHINQHPRNSKNERNLGSGDEMGTDDGPSVVTTGLLGMLGSYELYNAYDDFRKMQTSEAESKIRTLLTTNMNLTQDNSSDTRNSDLTSESTLSQVSSSLLSKHHHHQENQHNQHSQGMLEKFMLPASMVTVTYENETRFGLPVRCLPIQTPTSPSVEPCLPFVFQSTNTKSAAMNQNQLWIFLHPNAEDIGGSATHAFLNFVTGKLGQSGMAIEYAGYGQAEGTASRHDIDKSLLDAVLYVIESWNIPSTQLILCGYSIGTGIASTLAFQLHQSGHSIGGLVLIAPFASIKSIAQDKAATELPTFAKLAKWIPEDYWNSVINVKKVVQDGVPVLISYAAQDAVVPSSESQNLIETVKHGCVGGACGDMLTCLEASAKDILRDRMPSEYNGEKLPIFHSLIFSYTLQNPSFLSWAEKTRGQNLSLNLNQPLETLASLLSASSTQPKAILVDKLPVISNILYDFGKPRNPNEQVRTIFGLVESLYSNGLIEEQTTEQWKQMALDFAWRTVVG